MTPTEHIRNLKQLRCIYSNTPLNVELHHCHGGSMRGLAVRGVAQKTNPYLQIPLAHKYHTGQFNPEAMGVDTWEATIGRQIDFLRDVADLVGYDVLHLAARFDEEEGWRRP